MVLMFKVALWTNSSSFDEGMPDLSIRSRRTSSPRAISLLTVPWCMISPLWQV